MEGDGRAGWLGDIPSGYGRPYGRTGGGAWGRQNTKLVLYASEFWIPNPSLPPRELCCPLSHKARRTWSLEKRREDLRAGCETSIYEEVCAEKVKEIVRTGRMVSSAFKVCKGDGLERKGRFVINFARQSRHWPKGPVKMETLPGFSSSRVKNDYLMSWDVKSEYLHFYLHPRTGMHEYSINLYSRIIVEYEYGKMTIFVEYEYEHELPCSYSTNMNMNNISALRIFANIR
jgi:hypothetical protein